MPVHDRVLPPLDERPARFSPTLFRLIRILFPLYARFAYRVRSVDAQGIDHLIDAYRAFQQGRTRLLLAFRHPHVDDAALFAYLFGKVLPAEARRRSQALPRAPFAYFIYDRGVPIWAGRFIGWLLPRMGATAVYRGKVDRGTLEEVRARLLDADQPMAIAPEGGVTYRERALAPLEAGVAHFAFWCAHDLRQGGRPERVHIVPIAIGYRHARRAERELLTLIAGTERELGLEQQPADTILRRVERVAAELLSFMERSYERFGFAPRTRADGGRSERERIDRVIEAALHAAERALGITGRGETIPRMRRIEQAAWDRIYRPDAGPRGALPPAERSIADRIAREASLALNHLQLLDVLVYLREGLTAGISDRATLDELIECATNLQALVGRLRGGDIGSHARLGPRAVHFVIGAPIDVTDRLDAYREERQAAVEALRRDVSAELARLSARLG